ncbi:hypothetical protein HII36_18850 [Nonomuraea sp. NN258]|uniref:hypothetical protein n=1 Tax=Nonomuraea antri TaxID=2730852 RepID=UPI001569E3A4|nr:hypothetical protein [Nonomuraea antri]NRQ33896.1 hypothetical protein [Nonomuraea antri]
MIKATGRLTHLEQVKQGDSTEAQHLRKVREHHLTETASLIETMMDSGIRLPSYDPQTAREIIETGPLTHPDAAEFGVFGTVLNVRLDELPHWLPAWCLDHPGGEPADVVFRPGCRHDSRLPRQPTDPSGRTGPPDSGASTCSIRR